VRTRSAGPEDAETIVRIHKQGTEVRIATFETRPRSAEDIRSWFGGAHPSSRGGQWNSGFRCHLKLSASRVLRWCRRVLGLHCSRGAQSGRGLAMEALIEAAEWAGFWKLISRVFVENGLSRKLLYSVGLQEVRVYEKHARLDGEWGDVVIVERVLGWGPNTSK
jgi:L-amino acid N-acyltransferase YncA